MRFKDFYTEASIRSIKPNFDIPASERIASYAKLSSTETEQLKTDGYVPFQLWPVFRNFLLNRSLASNPELDPEKTAYTPGETLHLLKDTEIAKWRKDMKSFKVPHHYEKIILVPCAKTKPWENATRGIYKDYNKLKNDHPELFFVTISEPLGIVPQTHWNDFPQYDNPGLFKDTVQRSGGLFTQDFKTHFNSEKQYKVPFDQAAYDKCIGILAQTIKGFLDNNKDRDIRSFVEDFQGVGTHSDMLTKAGFTGKRLLKRETPRNGPYSYIQKNLN